jgi:hypothetical protein
MIHFNRKLSHNRNILNEIQRELTKTIAVYSLTEKLFNQKLTRRERNLVKDFIIDARFESIKDATEDYKVTADRISQLLHRIRRKIIKINGEIGQHEEVLDLTVRLKKEERLYLSLVCIEIHNQLSDKKIIIN